MLVTVREVWSWRRESESLAQLGGPPFELDGECFD